jgi:hypothetical protein
MFYTFSQNNSGGSFVDYAYVIIEADNHVEANELALEHDLYFDGASDDGPDCPCCGDRWYAQYDDDEGTDKPEIYGENVLAEGFELTGPFRNDGVIYMKNGDMVLIGGHD